ncbi:MAG: N-acetyl-gamma-glutamyl-phosphate reductase [Candidatus Micrarchaeia archaeon]
MGITATVIGASGYAGGELLRLLFAHPMVESISAHSKTHAGRQAGEVHPGLAGSRLEFSQQEAYDSDIVFFATPHGVAMELASKVPESSKIVDLSADFRLPLPVFEKWYKVKHASPGLLAQAVYGMPELNREKIRKARLVANPGCYPTGAILAAIPVVENFALDGALIVDSESGTSGAGIKPLPHLMFSEMSGNVYPYNIGTHRHTPEISHNLKRKGTGENAGVLFVPSVIPVARGISTTVYARLSKPSSAEELASAFASRYGGEPFVRLTGQSSIKSVAGTNFCEISPHYDEETRTAVIVSAIDNLVKGAAGTAVHNMNLMFGFKEEQGLVQNACRP